MGSLPQFRELAMSLQDLPGRIQAIQLFRKSAFAAVATWEEKTGWQVLVAAPRPGGFQSVWTSGPLDETFHVSAPQNLRVFSFGDGTQAVEFAGCAAHNCGTGGVLGAVVYAPSKGGACFAKSVLGKVTYSPDLESPQNRECKAALDHALRAEELGAGIGG